MRVAEAIDDIKVRRKELERILDQHKRRIDEIEEEVDALFEEKERIHEVIVGNVFTAMRALDLSLSILEEIDGSQ